MSRGKELLNKDDSVSWRLARQDGSVKLDGGARRSMRQRGERKVERWARVQC